MVQIKIKLDGGIMPSRASELAAAYDVYVPENVVLRHGRQVVDLMFFMEMPHGKAAVIQPRSGFSSKGMECVYKSPDRYDQGYRLDADVIIGLIDEDYRGHVGVIIDVHESVSEFEYFILEKGTRLAQMRIVEIPSTEMVEVDELDMSRDRGGGFGHTGTK